jgi:hypothetical protein
MIHDNIIWNSFAYNIMFILLIVTENWWKYKPTVNSQMIYIRPQPKEWLTMDMAINNSAPAGRQLAETYNLPTRMSSWLTYVDRKWRVKPSTLGRAHSGCEPPPRPCQRLRETTAAGWAARACSAALPLPAHFPVIIGSAREEKWKDTGKGNGVEIVGERVGGFKYYGTFERWVIVEDCTSPLPSRQMETKRRN